MDNKHDILNLLRSVADGTTSPEDALLDLKEAPFEDLDYAKIDLHRSVRQGAAEVIYGAGKTPEQIRGIVEAMGERGCRNILVTRLGREAAEVLADAFIWKIRTYEINVFLSLSQIDGQPCLMFTVTGQSDKLAGKGLAVFF